MQLPPAIITIAAHLPPHSLPPTWGSRLDTMITNDPYSKYAPAHTMVSHERHNLGGPLQELSSWGAFDLIGEIGQVYYELYSRGAFVSSESKTNTCISQSQVWDCSKALELEQSQQVHFYISN